MKRFIEGENRSQSTLFPESLDDYISDDNAVRVVDAFVNKLDLKQLGFDRVEPSATGRPGYQPATLLKIYVYGYLNRLQKTQANIDRYLAKLDAVDKEEPEIREVTAAELQQKIVSMEAKMEQLKGVEAEVEAHPDSQVSVTDPDARSMMKAGGGSSVSYNVQTAVDSKRSSDRGPRSDQRND